MASHSGRRKSRRDDDENEILDKFSELSLSRINGEINKMTKNNMIQLLNKNNLHTKGVKQVLGRRLKIFYRKQRSKTEEELCGSQYYKHFIVLDFEATCEKQNERDYVHEIIEFPAILLDAETGKIIAEFHSYCQPTLNPKLSDFCTSLTGIKQSDVDAAPEFAIVFNAFEKWMLERNLLSQRSCAFISDGPWDFSRFLNMQCCLSGIKYPKWARKWINLKKVYGNFYKINKPKLEEMLTNLGLKFEGRLHCGLDDARNMSKIVLRLIVDGCILQVNERLNAGRLEPISEKERESFKTRVKSEEATESSTDRLTLKEDGGSDKENFSAVTKDDQLGELEDLGNTLASCHV